jgi:lipoyl(octanoyl) transferase
MNWLIEDLGLMGYTDAWEHQKALAEAVMQGGPEHLLFVRHPRVLTLGANFHEENLLFSVQEIEALGVEVARTDLEETMLLTLGSFGLQGRRFPPHTGAWIGDHKVAALGVKIRRWVSLHGIALNCDVDLGDFSLIIPCGIKGFGVTSLSRELGRTVTPEEAIPIVTEAFRTVFFANA